MEIRELEYFIAASETGSFTRAAKELHLTQQGISKAVARLEQEFGMNLFIREKSALHLTAFGAVFYEKAKHLLNEYHQTVDSLQNFVREQAELRIGFAANVLPVLNGEKLIVDFKRRYPDIAMQIINLSDYECEEALLQRRVDAAFSMGPFSSSKIQSLLVASEAIFAILSVIHPLASRDSLHVQDLDGEPLIIADSRNKGYDRALSDLRQTCHHVNIIFQTSDPITHLRMASGQLGISLIPDHMKDLAAQQSDVRVLPVDGMPRRDIYFIYEARALKSRPVRRFLQFTGQFYENRL